ncbi:MAG: S49 family peptidase [Rhodospirillales bacterium]|nr:S49 family peptidase [Rhodospirillales bacterium]
MPLSLTSILPGRFRKRRPIVAVVRLAGIIGSLGPLRRGLSLAGLSGALERAFKLKGARAVALSINSPGGSPVQSSLIAGRVRALAEQHHLPVLAFVEDVAASGGYWLATAADEIYADASSVVGSIGVVSAGFGFQEALGRLGIERRVHTAGDYKAGLDPFRPERAEDVAHLKSLQAEIHEAFRAQVRNRRQGRLAAAEDELFNGRFWTGATALRLGLVDGLGDIRSVLRERFGDDVKLRVVGDSRRWRPWRMGTPGIAGDEVSGHAERLAGGLIAAVEERMLWNRFGL